MKTFLLDVFAHQIFAHNSLHNCMQNNSASKWTHSSFYHRMNEWSIGNFQSLASSYKLLIKRQKSIFDYQVRSRRRVVWGLIKSTVPEDERRVSVWNYCNMDRIAIGYVGLCSYWTMVMSIECVLRGSQQWESVKLLCEETEAPQGTSTAMLADDDSGWLS